MDNIMNVAATTILSVGLVPLAAMVLYLLWLVIAAMFPRPTPPIPTRHRHFRVVVPAHNEALVLEPVLRRLAAVEYPASNFDVVVVADNCSDDTAAIARACGIRVLERSNLQERGKGHALAYAFTALREETFDAYVILDADTLVEPNVLAIFNRYLDAGHRIVQAHYDVLDPFESQRTTLMYIAFSMFNYVRPLGRRVLGLSTGLKGNGMCFSKPTIDGYPWQAFSLAEDIEYTTTLLLGGERIVFAPEAHVLAQMPSARPEATTQRVRWEAGRFQLARRDGFRLLWMGIRRRDGQLFDWGMDLLIPPLALLTLLLLGGTFCATVLSFALMTPAMSGIVVAWISTLVVFMSVVGLAMVVGKLPARTYRALLGVPGYVVWKLWLYVAMVVRRKPQGWIRTERKPLLDHERSS